MLRDVAYIQVETQTVPFQGMSCVLIILITAAKPCLSTVSSWWESLLQRAISTCGWLR